VKEKKPVTYENFGKRPDSMGLFWNEPKAIKPPPAEKVKRIPPEPTWLEDDYLPNLEEALAWNPDLYTPEEMWQAASAGERVVFDIESYPDYFLIMFKSVTTGKICYFEKTENIELAIPALQYITSKFCLIGFNSYGYDIPILTLAMAGASFEELQIANDLIIKERYRPYEILRHFKKKSAKFNHIDLISVAPLSGSLKEYGGRMHTKHMQDLPEVNPMHRSLKL